MSKKFTQILMDHDDVHVAKTVVYADLSGNTSYAYVDSEMTVKFTKDELLEAFLKGCIVCYVLTMAANDIGYFVPTVCYSDGSAIVVQINTDVVIINADDS